MSDESTTAAPLTPAAPAARGPAGSAAVAAAAAWWWYAVLAVGVFACSTAVVMIKAVQVHPASLAAWRLLLAAAVLTPVFVRDRRRDPVASGEPLRATLRRSLVGGVLLAAHFVSWAAGAKMTAAANGALVVNLAPVVMPFLMFALAGERVTRAEVLGSALALAGVLVLTTQNYTLSAATLAGDVTCFGSMLLFAAYLAVARTNRGGMSLWAYVVPLYWIAGLLCLGTAAAVTDVLVAYRPRDYALLVGLAVVPTIVGHTILNAAMNHLRGQTVSVFNLGQFVFAGAMAWALFGEVPVGRFYVASALVVAGVVIVVMKATPMVRRANRGAIGLAEE